MNRDKEIGPRPPFDTAPEPLCTPGRAAAEQVELGLGLRVAASGRVAEPTRPNPNLPNSSAPA